jgi:hypothetical protein
MTPRHLTLKKLLIAEAVLIPIYIVILRWFEHHYAPSATMFTGLVPPWDYDPDGPQPLASIPLALTMLIGGSGYLLFLAARRLFRWSTEVRAKHLNHQEVRR